MSNIYEEAKVGKTFVENKKESNGLIYLNTSNGKVSALSRKSFSFCLVKGFGTERGMIIDKFHNKTYTISKGMLIAERPMTFEEGLYNPPNLQEEVFDHKDEESEEEKIIVRPRKSRDFGGKKCISFSHMCFCLTHPALMKYSEPKHIEDCTESVSDKLVKICILAPDQFDEIFTVEVDRPESPLMRRYLENLAVLVNEELSKSEEGVENFEELQAKAYSKSGFEGKKIQTVIEEAKDYGNHFRYLLTRDEKTVITEEQSNYFKSLLKIITSSGLKYKKNSKMDFEVTGNYNIDGHYFKEKIPSFAINREIHCDYFSYVDKMTTIKEWLEQSNLPGKIALDRELALQEYPEVVDSFNKFHVSIFICDKNLNYAKLEIKKTTIDNWKKILDKTVISMIANNTGILPEFSQSNL